MVRFPSPLVELNLYRHHKARERQARRILLAADPETRAALVAEAMYKMNRFAYARKHTQIADVIYWLKDRLIEHFYRAGYCLSARCHAQIKRCYYCTNGKLYGGGECFHCGGDGVYSKYYLMCFDFLIGGVPFSWHIPASRLHFAVQAANTWDTADEWRNPSDGSYQPKLGLAVELVVVYLSWYGLSKPDGVGDFVRSYLTRVGEWFTMAQRQARRRLALAIYPYDQDIPF